jgi:tRNA nucleotidyltransferase (CCA-adding enzyme)
VLWGQLYRFQNSLRKLLKHYDFKILRDSIWTNEKDLTVFIIEFENHILSKVKEHIGPPLEFIEQCNAFLSKYSNNPSVVAGPYIKNKRWIISLNRNYSEVKSLLKEKLSKDSQNIGIPKLISKALIGKLQILIGYEIVDLYQNNSDFAEFLSYFLLGKPFWL